MPKDLITLKEAAELRGYADQSAINKLLQRGRLRRYEAYGKPLVSRSEVLSYNPDANKGGRPPNKSGPDGQVKVKTNRKGRK